MGQTHLALFLRHPMVCTGPNRGKTSVRGFIARLWRPLPFEPFLPTHIMVFKALRRMALDQGLQVNP